MSAPSRITPFAGAEVHILDGAPPLDARDVLSPGEIERAARLRGPGQGAAYACAHAALRRLLAQRTHRRPQDLRFTAGAHGKPVLEDEPALHFSISYRAECVAVAIATRPVGIDVERVRPGVDAAGIAQRFFTREEQAWLASAPVADAFHVLWTRKEALVKAAGVGIDGMPRASAHGETAALDDEHGRSCSYRIRQLEAAIGFAAAIALEETGIP